MEEHIVTNSEILEEVMKIHVKIAEIQLLEAGRVERERVASDMLYTHDRCLNGNGKAGLKSEVQSLREGMARVNWLGAVVVVAIVADIVSRIYK